MARFETYGVAFNDNGRPDIMALLPDDSSGGHETFLSPIDTDSAIALGGIHTIVKEYPDGQKFLYASRPSFL